jgi:hypothetical protein
MEWRAVATLSEKSATWFIGVLAELSALARCVRATSPDSVLAEIADAKIGRIIALCGDANI